MKSNMSCNEFMTSFRSCNDMSAATQLKNSLEVTAATCLLSDKSGSHRSWAVSRSDAHWGSHLKDDHAKCEWLCLSLLCLFGRNDKKSTDESCLQGYCCMFWKLFNRNWSEQKTFGLCLCVSTISSVLCRQTVVHNVLWKPLRKALHQCGDCVFIVNERPFWDALLTSQAVCLLYFDTGCGRTLQTLMGGGGG